jgi:hypothetical protein
VGQGRAGRAWRSASRTGRSACSDSSREDTGFRGASGFSTSRSDAWLVDRLKALLIGGRSGLAASRSSTPVDRAARLLVAGGGGRVLRRPDRAHRRVAGLDRSAVLPTDPLADGDLRDRLLALARRAGVEAIGVYVADQSRKSRTANAAVVGLGRTRRIILFDTLLAEFAPRRSSRCWRTSSATMPTATCGAASS